MTSTTLAAQQHDIVTKLRQMVNADLREVCRQEGLMVSGRKSELQSRIENRASSLASSGDANAMRLLLFRVTNPQHESRGIAPPQSLTNPNSSSRQYSAIQPNMTGYSPSNHGHHQSSLSSTMSGPRPPLNFRQSPFYTIKRMVGQFKLPVCQHHRNAINASVQLNAQDIDVLTRSSGCVLLCAAEMTHSHVVDVSFPTQLEIRVNYNEVRTNTKGVKGKAGSTKPIDITPFMRKRTDGGTKIAITYALTTKVAPQISSRSFAFGSYSV
jgi:E3 SUMO-protein ligase PIAS1